MRILVTGGAGFIGSELCRQLVDEHEVCVIDSYKTAREGSLPDGVDVVRLDLGTVDSSVLSGVVEDFAPERCVHLAAIHYIPYCIEHPDETFAVNVRSTEIVTRALAGTGCERMVFTSTADVYPVDDAVHREGDRPAPRNVYGQSKLLSEHVLEFAAAVSDTLSGTCVRLANVYGPGETNPHVIPDAMALIADRDTPSLRMGYLGSERDFVHVSDVARSIITCLQEDTGEFSVFNIGSGSSTPIRHVVATLQRLVGDTRPIEEDPARLRKFDRRSLHVDISRMTTRTSWRPSVALDDGLAALMEMTVAAE